MVRVVTSTNGSVSIDLTMNFASTAAPVLVREDVYKGSTLLGTTYRNISFTSTYTPPGLASYALSNLPLLFSMRILPTVTPYTGPLVNLRRVSDSATQDFFAVSGVLDVAAVNAWLGGSTATVNIWYNQGPGPNATTASNAQQPVMQLTGKLGAVFNGAKKMTVAINILSATNNGVEGTVMIVAAGSNLAQDTYGVSSGSTAWGGQINYSSGNCYFLGGGSTGQSYQFFSNPTPTTLSQYSFKRNTATQVLRKKGVTLQTGARTGSSPSSTGFGLGYYVGGAGSLWTGTMSEFIMSNTAMTGTNFTTAENEQITYWGV